jgi:hypothetical protein
MTDEFLADLAQSTARGRADFRDPAHANFREWNFAEVGEKCHASMTLCAQPYTSGRA